MQTGWPTSLEGRVPQCGRALGNGAENIPILTLACIAVAGIQGFHLPFFVSALRVSLCQLVRDTYLDLRQR